MKNLIFVAVFAVFATKDCVLGFGENENFTDFLNGLLSYIGEAQNYVIPLDNSNLLNVTKPDTHFYGSFDFIIIGAGGAGAVLANRLSEIGDWNILLLEAGGQPTNLTKVLGLSFYNFFTDASWGYNTTEQKNACLGMQGKRCLIPTGKVLGGGTSISEGLYVRGHPEDYNRWVDVYGNKGWSWKEVLPYFKKSENALFEPRDREFHGEGGYFDISVGSETPGLEPILFGAAEEIGIHNNTDHNGQTQYGISKVQVCLKGNERVSTATAFLDNFTNRTNLNISTHSFVTKILINEHSKIAHGVEFVKNGVKYVAKARKEVIVSAGSINSAQLLMLSGIGPKKHLKELSIPVLANLPVGQTLQDHVMYVGIFFRTSQILYDQTVPELLQLYTQHLRPLTAGFNCELVSFPNITANGSSRPEIEYAYITPVMDSALAQFALRLDDEHTANFNTNGTSDIWVPIVLLHPKSRGTVTLQSNDPKDKPLIDPNYLSDEENHDLETLYKAVQVLVDLNATSTYQKQGIEMFALDIPGCTDEKFSKDWWLCSLKHMSTSIYHPAATNMMGPSPKSSVVDTTLRVHGMNRLRVIDASVVPEMNSGHLMPPVVMIAEKAADMIKEDHEALMK